MALTEAISTEEQAQLDAMRAADSAPIASAPEPVAPEPVTPASDSTSTEPAATEPGATGEPEKRDFVPLKTFLEERRKLEERLSAEQKRSQTMEERTNLLIQRFSQPQVQPAPQQSTAAEIPDVNKDPMGHLVGVLQQMGMNQQQLAQAVQMQDQSNRQQAAIADLQRRAAAAEQEFRGTTPDYDNAVQYAMQKRNTQLEIAGVSDAAERLTIIQREGLQLAAMAQQNGRNPAAVLYDMAKAYGYATPAPAAAVAVEPAAATDPAAATERLQTLAAGQQQARSLGQARGNAPPATPPAQRLIEMPQHEFAAMLDKATPEKLREMFGS